MSKVLQYKDYTGSVELSAEDGILYGKVLGIRALISYEGTTVEELVSDFKNAIDDYLELCSAEGKVPEKAYKGSFNIRISPELHKKLAIHAMEDNVSLNRYIERTLEAAES